MINLNTPDLLSGVFYSCFTGSELLDDGDLTDTGERLHLAVSSVYDADDEECQREYTLDGPENACNYAAYNGDPAGDSAYDAEYHAENSLADEQHQTLICVITCEFSLACKQRNKEQKSEIADNTKYLIVRIHNKYLLKYMASWNAAACHIPRK